MKTRFTSNEIAHVWAHKSAPHGKSPGAMSFDGDSFYSYGTVIARHVTFKGKQAIILNDTGYSVSTSKHQGYVRRSIPDAIPVFKIGRIGRGCSLAFDGREGRVLFEYAVEQSAIMLDRAKKARLKSGCYEASAAHWLSQAKQISEFFGLRRKVDEKTIERLKASSLEAERKEAKKRAQAEEKARIEQAAAFEAWKRGETVYDEYGCVANFSPHIFPIAFRIEGGELVSSRGARVPVEAARVALRFVMKHRESGWHRNGSTCEVGYYHLDAITPQGVVAGCHRITWEEVERVAAMLA